MTISTLPAAPGPTDSLTIFNSKAFALVAALDAFVTEANDQATDVNADALAAAASQAAAALSEIAAAASAAASLASAQASAASAGAIAWVSGTTYAIGDVRWSPANYMVYRRKTAGAGTTDPSADTTNWAFAASGRPQLVVVTGTSVTASSGGRYALTNVALTTVTLPLSPSAGDEVEVLVANALATNVIARNGEKIMGLSEDMTINLRKASVRLMFLDSTNGWRIV